MDKKNLPAEAEKLAPARCPELDNSNYLKPEQTPYIKEFIKLAKEAGYSNQDILNAWDCVYARKCAVPVEIENSLTWAVKTLFQNMTAHEMKLHYAARIEFMAEP